MNRREFFKLSAVGISGVATASWLFDTPIAAAATPSYISKNGILEATLVAEERMISYKGGYSLGHYLQRRVSCADTAC